MLRNEIQTRQKTISTFSDHLPSANPLYINDYYIHIKDFSIHPNTFQKVKLDPILEQFCQNKCVSSLKKRPSTSKVKYWSATF